MRPAAGSGGGASNSIVGSGGGHNTPRGRDPAPAGKSLSDEEKVHVDYG